MQGCPLSARVRAGSGRQLRDNAWLASRMEACVFLVGAPVFNTGERRHPSLAGSIPVRLRRVTFVGLEPGPCTAPACRHQTPNASDP
jgi:hypothetical protein